MVKLNFIKHSGYYNHILNVALIYIDKYVHQSKVINLF